MREITKAEEELIEAAIDLPARWTDSLTRYERRLVSAVRILREERKPRPRYAISRGISSGKWMVEDALDTTFDVRSVSMSHAEKVATALNAMTEDKS